MVTHADREIHVCAEGFGSRRKGITGVFCSVRLPVLLTKFANNRRIVPLSANTWLHTWHSIRAGEIDARRINKKVPVSRRKTFKEFRYRN